MFSSVDVVYHIDKVSRAGEDGAPSRQVDELGDVPVSLAAGGLVHADEAYPTEVHAPLAPLYPVVQQAPQAGSRLSHRPRHGAHGHLLPDQRQGVRLEEEREARSLPRPGDAHRLNLTRARAKTGDAGVQVAGVLEEVQVTPGFLHRVVSRQGGARGGGEAGATAEVQPDVEFLVRLTLTGRKFHPDHLPGLTQVQTQSKESL